jgi:hypothetical protein
MAKNKEQLQWETGHYRAAVEDMRAAHRDARYSDAVAIATKGSQYIDGTMQYERRFESRDERKHVETIQYVFQYAPLVFDRASLETVAELLKSQKRIAKNTTADLAAELESATQLMWDAHRLWTLLEQAAEAPQDNLRMMLGGDQDRWRAISESWSHMGLVHRVPERGSYRISLVTQVAVEVRGKCSGCGATGKAAMGTFLQDLTCPKCKTTAKFVMLPAVSTTAM